MSLPALLLWNHYPSNLNPTKAHDMPSHIARRLTTTASQIILGKEHAVRLALERARHASQTPPPVDTPLSERARSLDVTVQAQILEVLRTARDVTGAGVLIITHDLGVVAEFADRALVMYEGGVARELRGPALTEANLVSAAVGIAEAREAALA